MAVPPVGEADLPMLQSWLNEPGVVRWWEGDDVSWEAVVRDYGPANPDATEHWIASVDGEDIGWIQCYPVADSPEEAAAWASLGVDVSTTAGIDYLVGEPARRGRGLGSGMIRAFVDEIVFGLHPSWTQAGAAPQVPNEASWRALARAGFRVAGDLDDPIRPCRLLLVDRPR